MRGATSRSQGESSCICILIRAGGACGAGPSAARVRRGYRSAWWICRRARGASGPREGPRGDEERVGLARPEKEGPSLALVTGDPVGRLLAQRREALLRALAEDANHV